MADTSSTALIALDWGTTNVRAAALSSAGDVLDERRGESGIGNYSTSQFEACFDTLTEDWPNVSAIACGMVGSRQGWHEARYLDCPASTTGLAQALTRFEYTSRPISIVPGLTVCHRHTEHDVMRGEETQISGLLANQPDFSGTVVLPGTHSKWARVEDGIITDFQTYMTGEIYAAFGDHTILRHSMEDPNAEWDDNAFAVAFGDIFMTKGSDWSRFFSIRAGQLINGDASQNHRERLSGYVIGSEFAAAAKDGFDQSGLTIIGTGNLVRLYELGARSLAIDSTTHRGTDLVWPALHAIAKAASLSGSHE